VTNQVWSPADGALLKKLREQARLEVITLARLHSLSSSQVKQLEDGGDSSFYTQSIKLATGRKLLMHFGADIQSLDESPEPKPVLEPEITPEETKPAPTTNIDFLKNIRSTYLLIFGALVVALTLIYFGFYRPVSVSDVKPANISGEPNNSVPIGKTSTETKTDNSTLPIVSVKPQESTLECLWGNEVVPAFASQSSKPGDYVHVVANTDASICIKDAASKVQVLHLKNSQSHTFRGRPPFDIFSNKLNEFKLFYQGNLLRLPSSNTTNINLKEQKYE
jgi:hypothetical protein